MTTPHKHAELIKKWADDPSQEIWIWDGLYSCWCCCDWPTWLEDCIYVIGERPASPPTKMCTLAGVEFPMPMTEAPKNGDDYWTINPISAERIARFTWTRDEFDYRMLREMPIFSTKEGVEAYSRALFAATKQAMESAK